MPNQNIIYIESISKEEREKGNIMNEFWKKKRLLLVGGFRIQQVKIACSGLHNVAGYTFLIHSYLKCK
jgi:hypothetical protein